MDLSIISFEQDVGFQSFDVQATDAGTLLLVLRGLDYSDARRVEVNGASVLFEVVSGNKAVLLAELPSTVTAIESVRVISGGPIQTTDPVSITWTSALDRGTTSGISALVQRVLKVLLTRAGSNAFSMQEGAGLHQLVGSIDVDRDGSAEFIADRVKDTADYFRDDPRYAQLPETEQLAEIQVLSSSWDRATQTVDLQLAITNVLGQTASVQVAT